jgi:gamma-glutamylcyclotransferase (GGCT)/AIG2-like uncharacterized protein YtfP
MKPHLYFAYGSNLDIEQMQRRCPTARPLEAASLPHHRLDFSHYSSRWQGGAADVIPHSDDIVWGVLYAMDDAALMALDRFEAGYTRVWIHVQDTRATRCTAVSYTVSRKGSFRPASVYLEKMLEWGARWRLPADYLQALERWR